MGATADSVSSATSAGSRKSRQKKRGKWLLRHQPERKEKYRKRQCRANHEQHHQLSKLSATHDVQHQRSAKKFHGEASQIARSHTAEMMRFRLCSELGSAGYQDILGRNSSAIARNLFGLAPTAAQDDREARYCEYPSQ